MIVETGSDKILRELERQRKCRDEYKYLGGQAEWAWGVPQIFQYLQNPMLTIATPQPQSRCAYWMPLLYLLLYSFGWRHPGRGLREWIDRDYPTDDLRLALIREIWGRRSELKLLSLEACSLRIGQPLSEFVFPQVPEFSEERERAINTEIDMLIAELARKNVDLAFESIAQLHFNGGFHLLTAIEDARGENRTEMFISNRSNRRAFFVVDDLVGWYRRLAEQGQMLPDAGNRSWHVDVFVKTVGFLGTYRKSRQTGLWFSGPHRLHEWGNLEAECK